MSKNESITPKWVKVSKFETFTEDVLFATKEDLERGRFCNIIYSKGCKADEDGYYLQYESLVNLPIEQ